MCEPGGVNEAVYKCIEGLKLLNFVLAQVELFRVPITSLLREV
jgi:hypothetical protein